jgi:hypothetical protein
MKQNILQTERVYYAIEQMEQISQVLIRKIETNIGMFHVNKLSQGTMELDGMMYSTMHIALTLSSKG